MSNHNTGNLLEHWCRFGYASRGIVYLIIGGFAVLAAIDGGGQSTKDSKSALHEIFQQPFGPVLLGIMAFGLVAYASWRLIQAYTDPDNHGTDAKGLAVRAGLLASFLTHAGLALFSFGLVFGFATSSGNGGGDQGKQAWTAWLLAQPFGRWLVGAVGVIVIVVGLAHIIKGAKAGFEKYFDVDSQTLKWLSPVCRFGLVARGVVFLIIGGFIISAAIRASSSEVEGLKGALEFLRSQPYGWFLFGTVALGLFAFGLYSLLEARYRHIDTPAD